MSMAQARQWGISMEFFPTFNFKATNLKRFRPLQRAARERAEDSQQCLSSTSAARHRSLTCPLRVPILILVMEKTQLALEVLWKIAGNFLFNPTAAFIIILFVFGLGAWAMVYKHNHNC